MKKISIRFFSSLLYLVLLLSALSLTVFAQDGEAREISNEVTVTKTIGFNDPHELFDGNGQNYHTTSGKTSITLEHPEGFGSLYMIFAAPYGEYTIVNDTTGESITCGTHGFIHEFIDLEDAFGTAPISITIDFGVGNVKLPEIQAFSSGQVPSTIQKWEPNEGTKMDMILFSTHSDDEQIFFAGVLPYYSAELDYNVLVVYMTDHHNGEFYRIHEALNGLWAVGVTTYPVFGQFMDLYTDLKDEVYWEFAKRGVSKADLQEFVVEQIRKYQPLVTLAHDFEGEYGHGQHMAYAEVVSEALTMSADASIFPKSAEAYGTWDVPKAYFHLYPENPIVMDWDQPLESFNGKTAFAVSRDLGFPCHKSQYKLFYKLNGYRLASVVERYSPCHYGLYRSLVGEDVQKNDFFENLTNYAEQERIAEEARLAEESRIAEEERLAELARQEEEAVRAATAETEPLTPQEPDKGTVNALVPAITILAGIGCILLVSQELYRKKQNQKN